jgi:uncharacterized protein (DUF433 family)/uncharacterized protein YuzE
MKISHDAATDLLTIRFREAAVASRRSVAGLTAEYDAGGLLLGIEVPQASTRLGDLATVQAVVLAGLGPPVSQGKPPSTRVAPHIVLDERGVAWVDATNVKVIEVVLDRLGGWDADQIHAEHPHLSLSQIHAALSYYHDHKEQFDAEIARQAQEYQELRAQQLNSPIRQKLRALGKLP